MDGAFGLWARACPELRAQTEGVEGADSWAIDGHKWLQTPYDSGFLFVRDEAALRRAMSLTASYLPHSADQRDPGDYTPELSRRARGFAVWAVLSRLGRAGVAEMVGRHCRVARRMAEHPTGTGGASGGAAARRRAQRQLHAESAREVPPNVWTTTAMRCGL